MRSLDDPTGPQILQDLKDGVDELGEVLAQGDRSDAQLKVAGLGLLLAQLSVRISEGGR